MTYDDVRLHLTLRFLGKHITVAHGDTLGRSTLNQRVLSSSDLYSGARIATGRALPLSDFHQDGEESALSGGVPSSKAPAAH